MAVTSRDERLKNEKVKFDERQKVLLIENAVIINKNFKGEERRHPETKKIVNSKGAMNFCIALNEEVADFLSDFRLPNDPDRSFNVQVRPAKDKEGNIIEGDRLIYIQIKVTYPEAYPNLWPEINMFSSKGMQRLGKTPAQKDELGDIDNIYINNADVKFRARPYTMDDGRIGLSAHLHHFNFDIVEDDMNAKWGNFPVETIDEDDF